MVGYGVDYQCLFSLTVLQRPHTAIFFSWPKQLRRARLWKQTRRKQETQAFQAGRAQQKAGSHRWIAWLSCSPVPLLYPASTAKGPHSLGGAVLQGHTASSRASEHRCSLTNLSNALLTGILESLFCPLPETNSLSGGAAAAKAKIVLTPMREELGSRALLPRIGKGAFLAKAPERTSDVCRVVFRPPLSM